jgi:hypothetical protein
MGAQFIVDSSRIETSFGPVDDVQNWADAVRVVHARAQSQLMLKAREERWYPWRYYQSETFPSPWLGYRDLVVAIITEHVQQALQRKVYPEAVLKFIVV